MVSRSAEVPVVGVIAIRALADGGLVAEKVIVQGTCSSNCVGQVPSQLLPDGMGGLLITANWRVAGRSNRRARFACADIDSSRFSEIIRPDVCDSGNATVG